MWAWGLGLAERDGRAGGRGVAGPALGPPSYVTSPRPSLKFRDHLAQEQGASGTSPWLPGPLPPLRLTAM